ncbi:MAG: hypothetical protein VZQ84_00960 [Anaerovoracaceae bacterium]|nr:hypothetical protein [Anaerovoracaceae bacterium]
MRLSINSIEGVEYLYIQTCAATGRVRLSDIIYVTQDAHSIDIMYRRPADGDGGTRVFRARGTVNDTAELLCSRSDDFYKCHSYLMANFTHIDTVDRKCVMFDDGSSVSMGENLLRETRKAFNAYISKK